MAAVTILDVIRTKRDGGELSDAQIEWFISSFTDRSIADEQASALLMAIVWRGLSPRELSTWTAAMIASGDRLDLSPVGRATCDKHSTGGVGDKVSLPLCPIVAACGVAVPQLSGRGLGHTGGIEVPEGVVGERGNDHGCRRYQPLPLREALQDSEMFLDAIQSGAHRVDRDVAGTGGAPRRDLRERPVRVAGPGTLVPRDFGYLVGGALPVGGGSDLTVCDHVEDAIAGADVVMILRIQRERQDSAYFPTLREYSVHYGLTNERLDLAKKDAIVLHPGPMNRGIEIASEVADSSRSLILDQVKYGVAVRMAVLYLATGGSPTNG